MYKNTYYVMLCYVVCCNVIVSMHACTHACKYIYIYSHPHTHTDIYIYISMYIPLKGLEGSLLDLSGSSRPPNPARPASCWHSWRGPSFLSSKQHKGSIAKVAMVCHDMSWSWPQTSTALAAEQPCVHDAEPGAKQEMVEVSRYPWP